MIKLFIYAFLQTAFVAANTYFIARLYYPAICVCGFLISLIWTWNVKRVVLGSIHERLLYSIGASIGCVIGTFISNLLISYYG